MRYSDPEKLYGNIFEKYVTFVAVTFLPNVKT
jgi:hypothetical protein